MAMRLAALVVLDIEFYSAQFYDIASIKLVIEIILSRLCVSDDHKHFVVDVLVWYRIAFFIPRGLSDYCVILNLELSFALPNDDHGLGGLIDLFRLSPYADKLDIIVDSQYLTASLSFYILLGDVLRLVIEETVRISRPSYAPHVNLVLRLLLLLKTKLRDLGGCPVAHGYYCLHLFGAKEASTDILR